MENSTLSPSPLSLSGKTVLVTRAAGQSSQFTRLLQQQGAAVIELPAIEITPPSSWQDLDRAIDRLSEFDWLILTSTNAVDYFMERLLAGGKSVEDLHQIKTAVVGQKTAAGLQQKGIQPDFIPPNYVADSLVEHFPDRDRLSHLKLLFPRVETGGREVLVKELSAQGATVVEVAAYESGCVRTIAPEVAAALKQDALAPREFPLQIDVITFASSKTVKCFYQLLQTIVLEESQPLPAPRTCLASIGPQTSIACREYFGRVDVEAAEYTLEGLTQAIGQWVKENSRNHE
ncbi:uroporphyrinogen-III synthase [Leptolyngbya ohadii]|uniref:uroporphyrinogen-III synthase n=1 Tax=Leptolyngbya ohadii TaxID=1962290 RepID=UPI000B59A55D|nr:uroporphyrinogen-III synthase [Leptolyngbya ohadii]